jgi:hypothetical protein
MKPFLRKISNYAIAGGLGAIVALNLIGCNSKEDNNHFEESQKKGATVVVKEVAPKEYKIVSEVPSDETTIILEELNGNKRILSKEELDELVKKADQKIENGTSPLTNPEMSSGGMSLGETILASAAGAIIGSWIGSKLFNNPNYQKTRARSYSSPSVMQRSKNAFKKSSATHSSSRRSGFFKSSSSSSSYSRFGG